MTTLVHLFGISPNVLDLVGKSLVFALLLALAIGIQFANMGLVRFKSSTNGDEKTPARDAPTLHSAPGKETQVREYARLDKDTTTGWDATADHETD